MKRQAEIPTKKPRVSASDPAVEMTSEDSEVKKVIKNNVNEETPQSTTVHDGLFHITDPRKRQLSALENGYLTDVTILIGDEAIKCHSNIVSFASPKLAAILRKKEPRLPDVDAHLFRLLLQIIYDGEMTQPQDVASLLQVGYVAHNLHVHTAVAYCAANLAKKVEPENLWTILVFAKLVDDAKLEEACLKTIRYETGTILQTEGFLHCTRATLESILKQNTLNVTELQLFQACVDWAKANSGESGNCRDALGSVLRWIRFRTFSAEDFAKYVCPTGLLCVQDERDIMRSCLTRENFMPNGASIQTSPRSNPQVRLGAILEIKLPTFGERQVLERFYTPSTPLSFSVNRNSFILGVKMRAWRSKKRPNGWSYEEMVYVSLREEQEESSHVTEVLARTTFRGQVKNGEMITIKFNRPCNISSNTDYTLHVTYARNGEKYRTFDFYKQQALQKSKNCLQIRVLDEVAAPPELHLIIAERDLA